GQELAQDGIPVRQAALEREPVDDSDRLAPAQLLPGIGGLEHELLQLPFESRAEREIDQGPLQFCASLYGGGKRRRAGLAVYCPTCPVIPPLLRPRPACG